MDSFPFPDKRNFLHALIASWSRSQKLPVLCCLPKGQRRGHCRKQDSALGQDMPKVHLCAHVCARMSLFIQFCIHYITRPHLVGIELENEMFTMSCWVYFLCSFLCFFLIYCEFHFVFLAKNNIKKRVTKYNKHLLNRAWIPYRIVHICIYHWHLFINIKTQWTMVMPMPHARPTSTGGLCATFLVFSHFILHQIFVAAFFPLSFWNAA